MKDLQDLDMFVRGGSVGKIVTLCNYSDDPLLKCILSYKMCSIS